MNRTCANPGCGAQFIPGIFTPHKKCCCKACANHLWYLNNSERSKTNAMSWRQSNHDKMVKSGHMWKTRNTEKVRNQHIRRRSNKIGVVSEHYTYDQFVDLCNRFDNTCLCCGKKKKLTADHVVPLSKGGSDSIDNIQPLCQSCNSSKGIKDIDYRSRT